MGLGYGASSHVSAALNDPLVNQMAQSCEHSIMFNDQVR